MTMPSDLDVKDVSRPVKKPGNNTWPSWLLVVGAVIGAIYLLNPLAGIIELIPDNLPVLGNLDEAGAAVLVMAGIQELIRRRQVVRS